MAGQGQQPAWRTHIMRQLKQRDRREREPFEELMAAQARAAERAERLNAENARLLAEGAAAAVGGATSEETAALKAKVYSLQEELTALHRRKGENAQQVIDLTSQVRALEAAQAEKSAHILGQRAELEDTEAKLERAKADLAELQQTNQLLKDEYQALQLTLTSYEGKLLGSQKENDRLLAQVIAFKEADVARLNRENEEFDRRRQENVARQLEEAAKDNKTVVSHMSSA